LGTIVPNYFSKKIFTIIIYDNKYQETILDYPFVILSHIAKVSSLVRYDSGMVCLPQESPLMGGAFTGIIAMWARWSVR
jgi:hypothetical protein